MSSDQPWPSEWLRGVLEVCVLRVLADGATYGYAIASRLTDGGLGGVKGGTLYPLLSRLERAQQLFGAPVDYARNLQLPVDNDPGTLFLLAMTLVLHQMGAG